MKLPFVEPYKIKTIENIRTTSKEERAGIIEKADFNLFNLNSEDVFIDLLTDSGTGAMSDLQWAEIMKGDESYAGARSFNKLKKTVQELTGFEYFLPTHQGRAAENVLFSVMVKDGDVVPGNSHFDTTKGHIEFRKASVVDCTIDEAFISTLDHSFKGNVDLNKFQKVINNNRPEKIPLFIMTMTCNSGGGQPVSMKNLKEVSALCKKNGIPLIIDGARFAENTYFIKIREKGYENKAIKEIVREIFSYADGMTMSSKKDGIVNMGGFIALRDREIYREACTYNIMFEGFITYGGMSGRDMGALAQGLKEATEFEYLNARIKQVEYLGRKLKEYQIPIMQPIGGHAVFVDAKKFFPQISQSEFPAQLLGVELFVEGGVRGVEIGTLLADRDPVSRENRYPALELLRLAVPRRVYTNNHMDYIAAALNNVRERSASIERGLEIVYEAPIMRHFTVKLKRKN
jgi:tryptophanase